MKTRKWPVTHAWRHSYSPFIWGPVEDWGQMDPIRQEIRKIPKLRASREDLTFEDERF